MVIGKILFKSTFKNKNFERRPQLKETTFIKKWPLFHDSLTEDIHTATKENK